MLLSLLVLPLSDDDSDSSELPRMPHDDAEELSVVSPDATDVLVSSLLNRSRVSKLDAVDVASDVLADMVVGDVLTDVGRVCDVEADARRCAPS